MTAQEAYKTFMTERAGMVVLSCHEYDSCFVFQAVGSKMADNPEASKVFDSLYAVDKKTGKISAFKPFEMPIEEYKRGKKINIFLKR